MYNNKVGGIIYMSKKSSKNTTTMALNIVSAVLAVFVIVAFFCMPVFTRTTTLLDSKSVTNVTSMDLSSVGFRSDEDVTKSITQDVIDGKDTAAKSLAFNIRENENSSFAFGLTLVMSYVALLFAVLTLVFSVLSLFTKTGKINMIFGIGLAVSLIVVFVGGLIMAGAIGEGLLTKYSVGVGAIISMIVGVGACVTTSLATKK